MSGGHLFLSDLRRAVVLKVCVENSDYFSVAAILCLTGPTVASLRD